MIKNRSFESELTKRLASKHEPKKFLKSKKEKQITMMPSGVVTFLEGRNKEKYETFFGVSLPKIKIHRTEESILKSKAYHAHSYAQGKNIYLGKDVKPIDTVEGQTVIAHEITHILQQKYLDMSSAKEMVDPSVELERKAQVVEDRVRVSRGIEESSGDYFKKWDVLPERSYQARVNNTSKFVNSKVVQRLGFDINWGDLGSSLVGATVNQAKNVGGALSEAGSTALNGVTSVGKFAASGYTGVVAEGADLLGYEDTADNFRDATNTLQKSAVYDLNEASSHLSKSGKYGTNFLGSVVGNQKVFSDAEIRKTNGIVEELNPSWKKNDKYNKTLTEFGNQAIGAGLGGVKNLTGDLFTMKYGSWQYKSAESYTNFMDGVGSGLEDFDKAYLQKNIITETLSNSVKGAVDSTIIKPGQKLAENLEEGKFIESGQALVKDANITSIAMKSTSGSLDGNITTLQNNGVISKEQAEKFKVGKDTALAITKLAFDIKNAKTKKDIANKRVNTLNKNIQDGKYTENRVKGLFTVSENAIKSANSKMLQSSFGLLNEGAKGFDKYQGKKDSELGKGFEFVNIVLNNKISYKNLDKINKQNSINNSLISNNINVKRHSGNDNQALNFSEKYNENDYMKFGNDADASYELKNFYDKVNGKYTLPKDIKQTTTKDLDALDLGEKDSIFNKFKEEHGVSNLVLSKMESNGLETYLERTPFLKKDKSFDFNYKFVFRGTWPLGFNPETGLQSMLKFDGRDIVEDAWNRGKEQAKGAKKIYQNYLSNEQSIFNKYKTKFQINMNFNEMNFVGHSLGGYLANSVMVDLVTNRGKYGGTQPQKIYAETYNALGLTIEEYEKYNQYKKDNPKENILSVSHRTEYDPVSHIGVQPEQVITHKLKDRTLGNKLGAHGMGNFLKKGNYGMYTQGKDSDIYKDKPTWFDKHIVDNDVTRKAGVTGAIAGLGIGATMGGSAGAALGSLLGPVGTLTGGAIGGVLGGGIGALTGAVTGILGGFAFNGLKWLGNKVVDGTKWLGNKAMDGAKWVGDKAVKGYNIAKKGANWFGNKVVAGTKWLGNKAIDGAKWTGDKAVEGYNLAKKGANWLGNKVIDGVNSVSIGTKNAYNFGAKKISQVSNFVSDKAIGLKNSVLSGTQNAYNFGSKKVLKASKFVTNTVGDIGDSISTGAANAYSFGEEKAEQLGDAVSEGWNNVTDLFKFAEVNRHKQEPMSQSISNSIQNNGLDTSNSIEDRLDELTLKIFRQLKNEVALEYVRSGKN